VEKRGSKVLAERVEDLLRVIEVLPLPVESDRHYGVIRVELEKKENHHRRE
jgi:hypothetical protein